MASKKKQAPKKAAKPAPKAAKSRPNGESKRQRKL